MHACMHVRGCSYCEFMLVNEVQQNCFNIKQVFIRVRRGSVEVYVSCRALSIPHVDKDGKDQLADGLGGRRMRTEERSLCVEVECFSKAMSAV